MTRFTADLEQILSVLMLDLPALKVLATAVALGEERCEAAVDAYHRITSAWTTAEVQH